MAKQCVFQDCHSTCNTPGRTLFAFPMKEPERLMKWLALTGCTHKDLILTPRYVCDLHFSPVYISANPRRRVLIGQAVPHSAFTIDTDDPQSEHPDTTEHENEQPDEYVNEVSIEFMDESSVVEDTYETELDPVSESKNYRESSGSSYSKRTDLKRNYEPDEEYESEINGPYCSANKSSVEEEEQTAVPPKGMNVVPIAKLSTISPNATVMVIKGVSYVQMPKHVYLAEQQIAQDEIKYWKNLVKSFKDQLDDINFD